MIETFEFGFPHSYNLNGMYVVILCLIISAIIIHPIIGITSIHGILSFVLLFFIIYVIVTSMTNENLSNDLPSTLYPTLPHTGLDGISLNNYVAGMDVNKYII